MKVGSGEQYCLGASEDVTGTCGCRPSVWVPVTWSRLSFLGTVHPHFADEDTEAQRGEGTSPRPQSSKTQSRTCTLPTVTLILSVSPQEFQVFKFPLSSCSASFFLAVLFNLRDCLPLLVPRLRLKPSPSAVKAQNSSHWTARECPHSGSYARCPFKWVTCVDSLNHAFRGEVELSRAHLGGEGPGLGRTVADAEPSVICAPGSVLFSKE